MKGRPVVWWSNVLHHGDGARQISTRVLDPHVFPDEVDWTTCHAFSGAYNPLRRECGLKRLLRHKNRVLRDTVDGVKIFSEAFF